MFINIYKFEELLKNKNPESYPIGKLWVDDV